MIDPTTAFVWNYPINWRDGFRVQKKYHTDIFTSRSRREGRRALTLNPRREFEFATFMDGDEAREFESFMDYAQDKPFIVPDWSRRVLTTVDAVLGASVLTFDAVPSWLVEGRALFLFDRSTRPTAVFVDSIAGTEVTLTDPLAADWPANSIVLPGAVGHLASEISANAPTNAVRSPSLKFIVEPGSEPDPEPAAAALTFNGREVCLLRPNWANGLDFTYNWPTEPVDFERGTAAYFRPFPFGDKIRRTSFLTETPSEMSEIEDWFDRMVGQRGEFYMPTGFNDLPPSDNFEFGILNRWVKVAGTRVYERYKDSTVFKAICITLHTGERLYRTVNSITLTAGGTKSQLNLSGPNWSDNYTVNEIKMISWMPLWRFASDILTVDWRTDSVAECDVNLKMLEHLTAES